MDQLKEIGKRLGQYIKLKNIGVNELGRLTQTSGAQISFIIKGKKYGVDKLLIILEVCKDLNPSWLMYGKGTMIIDESARENVAISIMQYKNTIRENEELKLLMAKLQSEIDNLSNIANLKDIVIDNLKSTVEITQEANKDLKEMIGLYKAKA